MKSGRLLATLSRTLVVVLAAGLLAWITNGSLRTEADFLIDPFGFSGTYSLGNFSLVFSLPGFRNALVNSLFISSGAALLAIILAFPGALALSRFPEKALQAVLLLVSLLYVTYPVSLTLPYFKILVATELVDSAIGILLAHTGVLFPLAVLLIQNALRQIPPDWEELALMLGMTLFQRLRFIILPGLSKSLAAILLVAFAISWREYLFSFLLSLTAGSRNLVVYQVTLANADIPRWGLLFAMTLVVLLPALLVATLVSTRQFSLFSREG